MPCDAAMEEIKDKRAIEVMEEDGINISRQTSNSVDEYKNMEFDIVITVCDIAQESCPYFPAKVKMIHRDFPDPSLATGSDYDLLRTFTEVRDRIRTFALEFVKENLDTLN